MPTLIAQSFSTIQIPVSLPQIADGLRRLSPSEFETLELLLDERAMRTIVEGKAEMERGEGREL